MNKKIAQEQFIEHLKSRTNIQKDNPILSYVKDDHVFIYNCSKTYPEAILYANESFLDSAYSIKAALDIRPDLLIHVPLKHRDNDSLAHSLLPKNPNLFSILSERIRGHYFFYLPVFKISLHQIKFLPEANFKDTHFRDFLFSEIMNKPDIYSYLPEKLQTPSMLKKLVSINGEVLFSAPSEQITPSLLITAINNNIDCIYLLDCDLPKINIFKLLEDEQIIPTLKRFSFHNGVKKYTTLLQQHKHKESLMQKIETVHKEPLSSHTKKKI